MNKNNKNLSMNIYISVIKDEIYNTNKFIVAIYDNNKIITQDIISHSIDYIIDEITNKIKNEYKKYIEGE